MGQWRKRKAFCDPLERRLLLVADLLGGLFDAEPENPVPAGGALNITFTIRNQGTSSADFRTNFYLSADSTISSSDTLIGFHLASRGVPGGGSITETFTPSMPATDPFLNDNNYFLGMIIDANGEVAETNEINNANTGTGLDRDAVRSEAHLPSPTTGTSVIPTPRIVPSTITAGIGTDEWVGAYDLDIYSFNASAGDMMGFDIDNSSGNFNSYLRVYDSAWNLIASNNTGWARDEPICFDLTCTDSYLETGLNPGLNYVVVSASGNHSSDPRLLSGRSPATTGTYDLTISRVPDLVAGNMTATPARPIGRDGLTTVNYSITNEGDMRAGGYTVNFYLSDFAQNISGAPLASISHGALAGGATETGSVQLNLGAVDPFRSDNNYHIVSFIDIGGVVNESDETNNIGDVSISSERHLPSPTTGTSAAGTPLAIGTSITANLGEDEWIGAYDVDTYSVSLVAGHRYQFDTNGFGLDSFLRLYNSSWGLVDSGVWDMDYLAPASGTYYVVVTGRNNPDANPLGLNRAAGSTGNYTLEARDVSADLVGDSFDLGSAGVAPDGTIGVNFRAINQGGSSGASAVGFAFYLSDDGVITPADMFLRSQVVTRNQFETDWKGSVTLTLPQTDPFRTDNEYWVGMIVDYDNQIIESNETNNSSVGIFKDKAPISSEANLRSPTDGNSPRSSSSPGLGFAAPGVIGSPEWIGAYDQEVYRIMFEAGERMRVDLDRTAGSLDSYLRLFDANWNLVASNDDGAAPGEPAGVDSYFEYTSPTRSNYWLIVSGKGNHTNHPMQLVGRNAASTGEYTITVNNVPAGPISGTKFHDQDSDGVREAGEPGLAGWTIYLDQNENEHLDPGETSTVTDATGQFSFASVRAGRYHVREAPQNGWLQTMPDSGVYIIDVASEQQVSLLSFGNVQAVTLSGSKYKDLNMNGAREAGEPGVAGWNVYVDLNNNGIRDQRTITIDSGFLAQQIPDPGTVSSELVVADQGGLEIVDIDVRLIIHHERAEQVRASLRHVGSASGATLFSNVGGNGSDFLGTILDDEATVPITSGLAPFAGRYRPQQPLTVFDRQLPEGVWRLVVQDDTSPGFFIPEPGTLRNWSITLTLSEPLAVTDASGNYSITDLLEGTYTVREEQRAGWIQTAPASGSHTVSLADGEAASGLDFGNFSTTLSGSDGNDQYYLRRDTDPAYVQLFENAPLTGPATYRIARSAFENLTFDALGGNDRLTVDLSRGNPIPSGGIDFLGGTQTSVPGDSLEVIGAAGLSGSYTPSASTFGNGSVLADGGMIRFTGLEPVTVSSFGTFTLTTPNANDIINIDRPASARNRISGTSGGVAFEALTFFNVGTIVLDTASNDGATGNDSINIGAAGMVATGLALLKIQTGSGDNSVRFDDRAAIIDLSYAAPGTLAVSFDNEAVVKLAADQAYTSLSIGPDAKLDVADHDLILQSSAANRQSDLATIQALLWSGRNGGLWNGAGINSSVAAADPKRITGLAVHLNDQHRFLIKYTYNGDANADGVLNADDYALIDAGYVTGATGYQNGDFDYSGVIDADDFFLIDKAFSDQQTALAPAPTPAPPSTITVDQDQESSKTRKKPLRHHKHRLLEMLSFQPRHRRR